MLIFSKLYAGQLKILDVQIRDVLILIFHLPKVIPFPTFMPVGVMVVLTSILDNVTCTGVQMVAE